jgi:VWFA-related protein
MCKWIALIGLAGLAAAQNPTFQTGARLVQFDVLVRNNAGPVKNLSQEDFIVEDKGKKVEVSVFEVNEAGKLANPAQPLPAGVASNRVNAAGEVHETATVVLYDKVNVPAAAQGFLRTQLLNLLAGLKAGERVGFYALGFGLQVVRDYGEDAGPLAHVAQVIKDGGAPDSLPAAEQALYKRLFDALTPMQELAGNQARVNITYPAFRAMAHHLGGLRGRKNVLWLASTVPLTFGNDVVRRANDEKEIQAFIDVLTAHSISLYPVDPGGAGQALDTATSRSEEGTVLRSLPTNQANSLSGNQGFRLIAEKTGGKAYFNTNAIASALAEVIGLGAYSYTLGFRPPENTLDGKYHKLEVKLVKKPETDKAQVTHPAEYLAWGGKNPPPANLAPKIEEYLAEPLDATGINLMGVANPDQKHPGNIEVMVRIPVRDLEFAAVGDKYVASFEMAVGVEGAQGVAAETFNLNWSQEQYISMLKAGIDVAKSVGAPPMPSGRFIVAIQDKATGHTGSLRIPFQAAPAPAPAR